MSCNEWERGSWTLSCAEYPKLRRGLVDAKNQIQTERFNRAVMTHAALMLLVKGRHRDGINWREEINNVFHPRNTATFQHWDGFDEGIYRSMMTDTVEMTEAELRQRWSYPADEWQKHRGLTKRVDRKEPRKPRKNDFPLATRDTRQFNVGGEASIRFDDEKRMVFWNVEENNHACDRAHDEPMGKAFFRLLGQVVWTRGTGGKIIGNDEYHEDSGRGYEGGGSYSKGEWPQAERQPVRFYR